MHRDFLATDVYREWTHGGSKTVERLQTLEIIPKTVVRVLLAEETMSSRWYWRLQPMIAVLVRICRKTANDSHAHLNEERSVRLHHLDTTSRRASDFPSHWQQISRHLSLSRNLWLTCRKLYLSGRDRICRSSHQKACQTLASSCGLPQRDLNVTARIR